MLNNVEKVNLLKLNYQFKNNIVNDLTLLKRSQLKIE